MSTGYPQAALSAHVRYSLAVRNALEAASVEFIDDGGGGEGVRCRKPHTGLVLCTGGSGAFFAIIRILRP